MRLAGVKGAPLARYWWTRTLPLKRGKVVDGREQLLIGGELFELEEARLYRGNGMVLGRLLTMSSGASRGWMSAVPCALIAGPCPS